MEQIEAGQTIECGICYGDTLFEKMAQCTEVCVCVCACVCCVANGPFRLTSGGVERAAVCVAQSLRRALC